MQSGDDVRFLKPTAQIWADALSLLETSIRTPGKMAWLKLSQLVGFDNGEAVIAVMNDLGRTMIVNYMTTKVEEALSQITGVPVRIKVIIDPSIKPGEYVPSLGAVPSEPAGTSRSVPVPVTVPGVGSQSQSEKTLPANGLARAARAFAEPPVSRMPTNRPGSDRQKLKQSPGATQQSLPLEPSIQQSPAQQPSGARSSELEPPGLQSSGARSSGLEPSGLQPSGARYPASHSSGQRPQPTAGFKPANDTGISSHFGLNPKYTFNTFVVGSNNRFCHSAAIAVSQRPGQTYNPLFIYGGVGLGKTHLMQAIAHQILSQNPNASVRYINCERFTNDLINSIRDGRMVDFRKRYRHLDVLLVDDIQFIEGKESTQEEFFHTFNALKESGKQIVISSDRPPKALSHLEERLRSRFEWGLISDIQAPDFETRLAILAKKCELDGISIDASTLEHIASSFTSNIRELEGALIRVNAFANFSGGQMDQLSLHNLLTPRGTPEQKPSLNIETVISAVAKHYKVEPADLKSSKRSQDLTLPRHIAMYLGYELMNLSYPRIGEAFGNRKHTSALYAYGRIKELIARDPSTASSVMTIKRQLGHD